MKILKRQILNITKRTLTFKHLGLIMRGERITIKTKTAMNLLVKKSNVCGWIYIVVTARDRFNNLMCEVQVQPSFFGYPLFM